MLLLSLIAPALAEPAPKEQDADVLYFPTEIGAKWVYQIEGSDKEVVKFISDVKVREKETVVTVRGGANKEKAPIVQVVAVSSKGLFLMQESVSRVDPPYCILKLPHVDRAKTDYEVTFDKVKIKGTMIAFGPEKVKVPAGVFEAIRVESSHKFLDKIEKGTFWYAPGVGLVKSKGNDTECVLKSFTPGKK
jgi:hypothetical protein